jgi:hypothetical protein
MNHSCLKCLATVIHYPAWACLAAHAIEEMSSSGSTASCGNRHMPCEYRRGGEIWMEGLRAARVASLFLLADFLAGGGGGVTGSREQVNSAEDVTCVFVGTCAPAARRPHHSHSPVPKSHTGIFAS